jgi:hypothetical protein
MESQKITVIKKEEIAEVVEKIIDAEGSELIIAIPRFAAMSESEANFRLMKREADTLGKHIIIESVDEQVGERAKKAGLEFKNPFFNNGQSVSDIRKDAPREIEEAHHKGIGAHHSKPDIHPVPEEPAPLVTHEKTYEATMTTTHTKRRKKKMFFRPSFIIFILLIIGGVIGGVLFLPKADIDIVAAKTSWTYSEIITIDKAISVVDTELEKIPGEVFEYSKNIQLEFPTTGRKEQAIKARGKITIYNAYNNSSQPLVATTRFETPDGKIFRIIEGVTVPGAKSVDGKIEPASISVDVIADAVGEAYNIGPVEKFTIPGFAGSDRFEGFYASSENSMSGGFVGEAPFPSEDDIANAKETTTQKLEESMKLLMLTQLPREFTLVDGATKFTLTKEQINTFPNSDGNFIAFVEGTMSAIAFRNEDLFTLLRLKLKDETDGTFVISDDELVYGKPEIGEVGVLMLPIDYQASLIKNIPVEELKDRIAGKSENDLKAMLFSVAGLESAEVALWPFWVKKTPEKSSRIFITVD